MELLPCPFCGGDAYIERVGNRRQSTIYECGSCGCRLETGEEFNHGKRWNERAESEEITRLRAALEWQPIETAPKDGTQIDLWSSKGFRVCDVVWDTISYSLDGEDDVDGWTDAGGHGSIEKAGPFTHWMPIPSAPTDKVNE